MEDLLSLLLVFLVAHNVVADSRICGHNSTLKTRSCSTQILGENHGDLESCKVEAFPPNSSECSDMTFGPFVSNNKIGTVSLKPYMLNYTFKDKFIAYSQNYIVLNITFSNIKWNSMRFRFQRYKDGQPKNHCRSIAISQDVAVSEQSVLYYDCYWSITDRNYTGQTHILDFEASDMKHVNRGRFLFNIPSESMLSTDPNVEEWRPFTYIEFHTSTMRLHILPPPNKLGIQAYHVQVLKECDKGTSEVVRNSTIKVENSTSEVIYDFDWPIIAGSYYFLVTPLHKGCVSGEVKCLTVESPRVPISSETQALNICIASVTALVVATLFAYYIVLRVLRKYWCKDYSLALGKEPPAPPRILVVYPNKNKLHVECVTSFVTYLRAEYGFDISYDNDVVNTALGDPYIWADDAFNKSTHIAYIVPPNDEANIYNNIYDLPIKNPHKNVDTLLLSLLRTNRASKNPKEVLNIFFDYSNGLVPIETRNDRKFYLLKDWQKMVSYLSKNMLPKQHLMKSEKGRCFLEDLKRAKKMLSGKHDDVIFKCEKLNSSPFEKKVLL